MNVFSRLLKSMALVAFATGLSYAAEIAPVAQEQPSASAAVAMDQTTKSEEATQELVAELALRDSIMAVRDSSCTAEKDSLRLAVTMGNAMCDSWKQSYETMRKDREACSMALNAAQEANEQQKDEAEDAQSASNIKAASSFLGGLGVGMLLFWLIFE